VAALAVQGLTLPFLIRQDATDIARP